MNQNNFVTNKAKATIREWPVAFGSNGFKLNGKVILPENASAESPVPGAVLCHGFGSSHRAMRGSARILAEQGIAVLIFDFRGHGLSEGTLDGDQAEDAVDAWNTLGQLPEVDKTRMGLVGHSLGALSAIVAAGKVNSPKALIALSCPPPITDENYPGVREDFGRWGRKHSRVIEIPNHGTLPWLTGISAIAARIWMYVTRHYVRVHAQKFVEGMIRSNMAEVLGKLDNCAKLFVFCEGDNITPYHKSVLVYEVACEPRARFLGRGSHGTPIARGRLRSKWTGWVVDSLLDRE